MNPYLLPDGKVQIAFSGGRTSAYMLHQILQANGPLPQHVQVTFQNTGREMSETLDFVAEVERRWSVPVVWLEYRPTKPLFEVVGHNSAARNGEPFEALIRKRRYLPNQRQRFCTQEMKILASKRYLRSIGWRAWTSAIGIRADEQRRLGKPDRDRWITWTPLANAGVTKEDVIEFWARQPFDLGIPTDCVIGGNCDGCFLKAELSIAMLHHTHPDKAAWWECQEGIVAQLTNSDGLAQFSKRYSRASMRTYMERKGLKALSTEGALCQKDEGECVA